jgi:hypothetical protein
MLLILEIAEMVSFCGDPARERHVIDFAVARDFNLEPIGKRVHTFGAHAVQAAGKFICPARICLRRVSTSSMAGTLNLG